MSIFKALLGKKNLLIAAILIICSAIVGGLAKASAQDTSIAATHANAPVYTSSLSATLDSVLFSPQNRELRVEYTVKNLTSDFAAGLTTRLNIYQGNHLMDEGYIFKDLTYVDGENGAVKTLDPREEYKGVVIYKVPENFNNGRYYIDLAIQDQNLKFFASGYTKEPVTIQGKGGFIITPRITFGDENTDGFPLEGILIEKGAPLHIKVFASTSASFLAAVKPTSVVTITGKVSKLTGTDEQKNEVMSFSGLKLERLKDVSGQGPVFSGLLAPTENITGGPYDIVFELSIDGKKVANSPLIGRWLVDGATARIGNVSTGVNLYNKEKNIDMTVDVFAENSDGYTGQLTASFIDETGAEIAHIVKDIDLSEKFQIVDFSDEKIEVASKITEIKVSLVDSTDQSLLDSKKVEVRSDQIFEAEKQIDWKLYTGAAIVIILLIILLIATRKNKNVTPIATTTMALLLIVGASIIHLHTVDAKKNNNNNNNNNKPPTQMSPTTLGINVYNFPEGNIGKCPKTAPIQTATTLSCAHCLNGIDNNLGIYDIADLDHPIGLFINYFPGGMDNTYTSYNSANLTLTAAKPSVTYYVYASGRPRNHGFCLLPTDAKTREITASCTNDSLCGSAGKSPTNVFSTLENTSANLCASGSTLVPSTFTSSSGGWSWKCKNSANDQEMCNATKLPPGETIACVTSPANPKKGDAVTWSVVQSDTNPTGYTYLWSGDVNGSGAAITKTFETVGTKAATVSVTKNDVTTTASCSVDITTPGTITPGGDGGCDAESKYCPTTNSCIPKGTVCPAACGNPVIASGGAVTVNTPNLCGPGFEIVTTSVFARTSTNSWYWSCRPSGGGSSVSCEESCPAGTFYEPTKGYCAVECPDWCPNIAGNQIDISNYIRDDSGHCLIPDGKIKYFKVRPDTSETQCPAFWETEVGEGADLSCSIGGAAVESNKRDDGASAVGFKVDAGKRHTLSCDVVWKENGQVLKTVTASTRCFLPTQVQEQ